MSSDSEDENSGNDYAEFKAPIRKMINSYTQAGGDARLQDEHVVEEFVRQTYTCLICIEQIRKVDKIWNCRSCYASYHIQCAQQWANESVAKFLLSNQEDGSDSIDVNFNTRNGNLLGNAKWCCPKCRYEYSYAERPKHYRCFCGKVLDPKPDLWDVPHSCGSICKRPFNCGHVCLMLCHPGQCPPCPKIVELSCFCNKSPPKALRCFQSKWTCSKPCGKKLACGLHRCEKTCHSGECQECFEKFERCCACGKVCEWRPCHEKSWSCGKLCDKILPCGKHTCSMTCHCGTCDPCASANRLCCPCGKTTYQSGDCIDDLKCCGDTCDKILDCGVHKCVERCHRGSCGVCHQERVKKCRCGVKEKVFTCGKEFVCEIKCKNKRPCGKHACNKKCCPGEGSPECCQPCEKVCNKTLPCGNHKCAMLCHSGPCYPCSESRHVKCQCGTTVIQVPCGQERVTKAPKCKQLCKVPPVCRHASREEHRCHFGNCPKCRQVCALKLKCGHSCAVPCHKGVLEDVNKTRSNKPAAPWEKVEPKFELIDNPCPPCESPVAASCFGGHVTITLPCFRAKTFDCGQKCAKKLSCGNHSCSLNCHTTTHSNWNCGPCEQKCSLPRPRDCPHRCLLPCHPGPCAECRLTIAMTCHCGLNQKLNACIDWGNSDKQQRLAFISCGNQCPKIVSCGHSCSFTCHPDKCSSTKNCVKRVQIRCTCRRKVMKVMCNKKDELVFTCDKECEENLKKAKSQTINENEINNTNDVGVENEELENINLPFARRKRKKKTRSCSECDDSTKFWHSKLFLIAYPVGIVSVVIYWWFFRA